MLSDLLGDQRAHPFFLEWRSPRDRTTNLPNLLLGAWAELDKSRGISDGSGLLASTSRPLAGLLSGRAAGTASTGSQHATASDSGHAHGAADSAADCISPLPADLAATLSGAADEALAESCRAAARGLGDSAPPLPLWSPERQRAGRAAYGYLQPERRRLLERMVAACDGDMLMDKVSHLWSYL